ncbi:hypothetical protein M8J76_003629 [Diaphorina citri]|nr:hypothetical protein M8J76_003629 [Diaphorina citri]
MSSTNIVENIKKEVEKLLESNEVEKAFSLLLTVIYLSPQCSQHIQDIFVNTLCIIGQKEEKNNNLSKLFKLYEEGIKHYPDSQIIYSNLGAHLFRLGYIDESISYFEKALCLGGSYLPAQCNLHNIYNLLVPRWHYAMLNDQKRNQSFESAIAEAIRDGYDRVLDIGTGTGLLREVYACDYSNIMIHVASQALSKNQMEDRIKLINKLSNDIRVPQDLPHKVSLIVTETVDAGGIGEHILQTVKHALEQLVLPTTPDNPQGVVIPSRLKMFAQVVECEYLRSKYEIKMSATRCKKRNAGDNVTRGCDGEKVENEMDNPSCSGQCKPDREDFAHGKDSNGNFSIDGNCSSNGKYNSDETSNRSGMCNLDEEYNSDKECDTDSKCKPDNKYNPDIPMEFTSRCRIESNDPNNQTMPQSTSDEDVTKASSIKCSMDAPKDSTNSAPNKFTKPSSNKFNKDTANKGITDAPIKFTKASSKESIKDAANKVTKESQDTPNQPIKDSTNSTSQYVTLELNARKHLNANYDSENFLHIPHKVLTQPVQVLAVDLNSLEDVTRVLDGVTQSIPLETIGTGRADAVIAWFELDLYKNITLSSSIQESNSWEQAVFPVVNDVIVNHMDINTTPEVNKFALNHADTDTTSNEMDEVTARHTDTNNTSSKIGKVIINHKNTNTALNEIDKVTMNHNETKLNTTPSNINKFTISHMDTKRVPNAMDEINDTDINITDNQMDKLMLAVTCRNGLLNMELSSHCSESKNQTEQLYSPAKEQLKFNVPNEKLEYNVPCDVIQACHLIGGHVEPIVADITERLTNVKNVLDLSSFPLLGIECLKRFDKCKLFYLLDETKDSILISWLTSLHIDPVRYYCLNKTDLNNDLQAKVKFDVVLVDVLDARGDFSALHYLSPVRSCLSDTGVLLPTQINIHCQLLQSDWLDRQDIDMRHLPHTPLSPSHVIACLRTQDLLCSSTERLTISPSAQGHINGISYWMDLVLTPAVHLTKTRGVFCVNPGVRCDPHSPLVVEMTYEPGYMKLAIVQ